MAEWTRHTPWRQGHLLPTEAGETVARAVSREWDENSLAIVATHDCDLAQTPDKEPNVEVIFGTRISNLNGACTHAKSPRTLHLSFGESQPLLAEFVVTNKERVSKGLLCDFSPINEYVLAPSELNTFQMWLASRYRRSAFPDEFERRLKAHKLDEKVSAAVKKHGELITAVFFDVDEGMEMKRSGEDDVYTLDIYLLHEDGSAAEFAATEAKATIIEKFKKLRVTEGMWRDIELRYVETLSEHALSYAHFKLLKKWRLDHVSLSTMPQQPVTP